MSIYKPAFEYSSQRKKSTSNVIATRKYSSPNSSLSSRQLAKLQHCINVSNDLLRSLGNPQTPQNLREFQLKLKSLKGKYVTVSVEIDDKEESIAGFVIDAGKDYLQLSVKGELTFIRYDPMIVIKANKYKCIRRRHAPGLEDLSTRKRSALTLHFGDTVSGNPTLLNRFFGIPLTTILLTYLHSRIQIKTEAGDFISGILVCTTKSEIWIQIDSRVHSQKLKLNQISILTVK